MSKRKLFCKVLMSKEQCKENHRKSLQDTQPSNLWHYCKHGTFFFYLQAFALLHLLSYTLQNLLGYTPVCKWRISDTIYMSSEKKTHRRLRWAEGNCFVKFSWVKNSARETIERVHKIPNPPIYGTTVNMEPFFPTCKHFTYFISYATLYTISRVTLLCASEGFRTPLFYVQRRSIQPSQLKAAA